jgi:predicted transposase YbfD/YdcC
MDVQATSEILRVLQELPDPRQANRHHQLIDILTIALLAVICGADGWTAIAAYGKAKINWLKTFLHLPHGIPSHDTFGRVFAKLNPDAFENCFRRWVASLAELSGGKLVAIDGKSIRRSFERGWDKAGMAHMVSAFVQDNHMVFGQLKTDGRGQEISAIEKLLEVLDLNGSVVTIDALGCQKDIAAKIKQAGGNYILQVKGNQETLLAKMQTLLSEAKLEKFDGWKSDSFQETNGGHGRIETRQAHVVWDIKHLGPIAKEWPGLKSMAMVERTRQVVNGNASVEVHYYISSLDARRTAKQFMDYIRGHWSVENNLHWQLDVSFDEDQRRIRVGHGAENFSRICRMSLNLLKNEPTHKNGIAIRRQNCGWDNDYLLKVLIG